MIEWPPKLVQELARRRCVPFMGAGVSKQSVAPDGRRPPLWGEFLIEALKRCKGNHAEIKKCINRLDYLTACQMIKFRLGDHDWHDLLEEFYAIPNYAPSELHKHIFNLDLPVVATTNIDKIYDRFLNGEYEGAAVLKNYHDQAISRYVKGDVKNRLVVKVHGSVDNPDEAVFTREQYANARNKCPQFFEILSALIVTQSFLFIGYSLSDPDIQLLLEDNARLFKSPTPHYMITSDKPSNDMKSLFEKNYSLKIIQYSSKNDHKELIDSFAELVSQTAALRVSMADQQLW